MAVEAVGVDWKIWVAVVAACVAAVATVFNVWFNWWLGRHKTQTEKTWEKRREVYTKLLAMLLELKKVADAYNKRHSYDDVRNPEAFFGGAEYQKFLATCEKIKAFEEANILYISDVMEGNLSRLWKKLEDTEPMKKRHAKVEAFEFEEARLAEGETVYGNVKRRAKYEIRVTD